MGQFIKDLINQFIQNQNYDYDHLSGNTGISIGDYICDYKFGFEAKNGSYNITYSSCILFKHTYIDKNIYINEIPPDFINVDIKKFVLWLIINSYEKIHLKKLKFLYKLVK